MKPRGIADASSCFCCTSEDSYIIYGVHIILSVQMLTIIQTLCCRYVIHLLQNYAAVAPPPSSHVSEHKKMHNS